MTEINYILRNNLSCTVLEIMTLVFPQSLKRAMVIKALLD